ncbi:hypothetical protein [Bradyrhizobium sp. HKCCYLS3013]|uniref:hypothetical protein n=1 Tax=Bradyrhizobium sp. HKCCYLS3013 TaxID=3420735 RepID=UPI003EBA9EFD
MAKTSRVWFVVDDQEEVDAYCDTFNEVVEESGFEWKRMNPSEVGDRLFSRTRERIAGVLVDIDLSSDPGTKGTGLGVAQDLRAKQKSGSVADYPLVRFANPVPVGRFVGADPVSNDLFDLLVSKESARKDAVAVTRRCIALTAIYDELLARRSFTEKRFSEMCGLTLKQYELWSDERLFQRMQAGMAKGAGAVHVGAGAFVRTFLEPAGLLIDEDLVAVRLGVDAIRSGASWKALLSRINSAAYRGVGSEAFNRWWARGLDAFWYSIDKESFLQELTAAERVERLCARFKLRSLVALSDSQRRFWRLCALSRERGRLVPIDPRGAISLVPAVVREPWLDPEQAALDVALMHKDDVRLDKNDLKRFAI